MSNLNQLAEEYYDLHLKIAESRIISLQDCTPAQIDGDPLESFYKDLEQRISIKLKANGKISRVLFNQLLVHHSQLGEAYELEKDGKLFCEIEFFQVNEILDIIEHLEVGNLCKRIRPFKGEHLSGLLHIHHCVYASMGYSAIYNCIDYWYDKSGNLKRKKRFRFEQLVQESSLDIAGRMYRDAINTKHKEGTATGEWLIFKKVNGINYYLCLAKHLEGDLNILANKIKPCFEEFPELSQSPLF